MGGSVPDRWLKYSCYGKVLIDKFVALKVPLSSRISALAPQERFTPNDAIKQLSLGLIIDLTNTKRYYDSQEFTSRGVDHVKIPVPGQIVPPNRLLERFNDIVHGYFNDPGNSGRPIGVHCTHGLNRTGYFVCAFLITELGYHPNDAINLFNATRGHKMERGNYLQSLRSMQQGSSASERRNDMNPWERNIPSRPHYRASYSAQGRKDDRTVWRQDRSQRQDDIEARKYNVDMRHQQDRTSWRDDRYVDNHRSTGYSRKSPEHNDERWDPTIRRIVRPRTHNFKLPSYRKTFGNATAKHTRFE